ncbi:MAG: HRDC domain-containing protein [Deltaproteobacteria bacterium]|nr:HRDC domain-containing protein [Deltaproteobacteria bacterium]
MELDEREKEAYEALRVWRAAKAKQEGIPPYMIANNKQLAKIVKLKAGTKAELAKVSGIGEAKIKQHGE